MSWECLYHKIGTGDDAYADIWSLLSEELAKHQLVDSHDGRPCPLCIMALLAEPEPEVETWAKEMLEKYMQMMALRRELGL